MLLKEGQALWAGMSFEHRDLCKQGVRNRYVDRQDLQLGTAMGNNDRLCRQARVLLVKTDSAARGRLSKQALEMRLNPVDFVYGIQSCKQA